MKYYLTRFFKRRSTFFICSLILLGWNLLFSNSGGIKMWTFLYFAIGGMYINYKIGLEFYDFYIGEQSVLESLLPISKKERGKGLVLGHILYMALINIIFILAIALSLYLNYLHIPKILVQEYGLSEMSTFILEHKWMLFLYGFSTILSSVAYIFLIYNIVEVVMGRWKKKYSYAIFIYLLINFIVTNFQKLMVTKFLKGNELENLNRLLGSVFSFKVVLIDIVVTLILLLGCIYRLSLVLKEEYYEER
ncbi:MAG: hypothetical protein Q4Q07_01515 [Tissierellia bacterium]|nr:hypothetical protein [Tissierellia bacterium]